MTAIEKYIKKQTLTVPRHAIERAVLNLGKMEAIALIRAAFQEEDGGYATLPTAKVIYSLIQNTYHMEPMNDRQNQKAP